MRRERSRSKRKHGPWKDPGGLARTDLGAARSLADIPKILVFDDDWMTRLLLRERLSEEGYLIYTAGDSLEAEDVFKQNPPDLLLLDVVHPGIDGFEFVKAIRSVPAKNGRRGVGQPWSIPIIFVTACDPSYAVFGLEAGADDWISKPFDMQVLLTRVRALLHPLPFDANTPAFLRSGTVEVCLRKGVGRRGEELILLTLTELRLLRALISQRGYVFSREELLHVVWGYENFGDPRLVDFHIWRLRNKVEENPDRPILIQAVETGYFARA